METEVDEQLDPEAGGPNRGLQGQTAATHRTSALLKYSRGAVSGIRGHVVAEPRPVSAAVVIGIGGSGVQTAARIAAAVRADRPDQAALSAVRFLGIDAVPMSKIHEQTPLPPGVRLPPASFLNLTATPFDATTYLRGQLSVDSFLASWWDEAYKVEAGPIADGLKRERMLGRLAFHRSAAEMRNAIALAMSEALRVNEDFVREGNPAGRGDGSIPVYIVGSAAGGTGSSGLLEVLAAVWSAAGGRFTPQIRAFIYLPEVFERVARRQPNGHEAVEGQQANAYAFFKELDHYLKHSSELPARLGEPTLDIPDGSLVKQVYLVGGGLRGIGTIPEPPDLYEITAEAIYHFLLTNIGMPLVGTDATNTDRALSTYDKHGKPRRYCSLGIARVVFPGDTFRNHLVMRWVDWFVRSAFLRDLESPRLHEVKDDPMVVDLVAGVGQLVERATSVEFDDEVDDFLDRGRRAPAVLRAKPEASFAEELVGDIERSATVVSRTIRTSLELERRALLGEVVRLVEDRVFSGGQGLPFAGEAVKVVLKQLTGLEASARERSDGLMLALGEARKLVETRLDRLEDAEARNFLEELFVRIGALFSESLVSREDLAKQVGEAVADWVNLIEQAEKAAAKQQFLQMAAERLKELRDELKRAEEHLIRLSDEAKALWERDDLIGKDAGAKATTVLVPADSQPQVEWSQVALGAFRSMTEEHAGRVEPASVLEFVQRWRAECSHRGFFDLGSRDLDLRAHAERTLLASIERDADLYALVRMEGDQRVDRLPSDLLTAATSASERLELSLQGIDRLAESVCWSWDEGRFHVEPTIAGMNVASARPAVTTVVACHKDLEPVVKGIVHDRAKIVTEFDDRERVIALSCEWAVPLHCLNAVPTWREKYQRLQIQRRHQRSRGFEIPPPSHIDKRMEALPEPVPDYFEPGEMGALVAKALLVSAALRSGDRGVRDVAEQLYARDATVHPVPPLRTESEAGRVRYLGHRLVKEEDRLRPVGTDVDLGSGVADVFRNLAVQGVLQTGIEDAFDLLMKALADRTSAVVESTRQSVESMRRARKRSSEDREALGHVLNGLDDLADALAGMF